jgi:hypothetical protein
MWARLTIPISLAWGAPILLVFGWAMSSSHPRGLLVISRFFTNYGAGDNGIGVVMA